MVISAYFWSHELTLFSSISELLQEKTEPTLFHTNPCQGEKINVNPHTMFFIVMTAAVVAVNAHGNSTPPSTAASLASSASKPQALTPAPSYEGFGKLEILNPSPLLLYNIIIINGY